jgi:ankyrin repeat protein
MNLGAPIVVTLALAAVQPIHAGQAQPPAAADPEAKARGRAFLRERNIDFERGPFMVAVRELDEAAVTAFIDAGLSPDDSPTESDQTPLEHLLMYACGGERERPAEVTSMVKLLIAKGADVNRPNVVKITPLMHAGQCSRPVVRALLSAGARLDVQDQQGNTPFDHALPTGEDAITELVAAGFRLTPARSKELLAAYRGMPLPLALVRKASTPHTTGPRKARTP